MLVDILIIAAVALVAFICLKKVITGIKKGDCSGCTGNCAGCHKCSSGNKTAKN